MNTLSIFLGATITIVVSASVWITLLVGLVQFAREEIRHLHLTPRRAHKLAQYSK